MTSELLVFSTNVGVQAGSGGLSLKKQSSAKSPAALRWETEQFITNIQCFINVDLFIVFRGPQQTRGDCDLHADHPKNANRGEPSRRLKELDPEYLRMCCLGHNTTFDGWGFSTF